ncbi:MAG: hypothetical protein PW999_07775 [Paraburkholderia tropica]|nr:hypothetical protein [Paraburkholderia tropica]
MDTNQLPDDLNPEVVKACAEFIGKITGLVPPPHDAFPPEWHGYLRTFTNRLYAVARENAATVAPAAPEGWKLLPVEPSVEALTAMTVALGMEPLPASSDDGYPITGRQSTVRQAYDALLGTPVAPAAVTPSDEEADDDYPPTPESERAAFNGMMRWHLIRLLQAWRYGGDLRAAGMAAFEWARTNDVGQDAFKASEGKMKISNPTPTVAADAAAPSDTCAHDYVRSDNVCTECGEKAAQPDERAAFDSWARGCRLDCSVGLEGHYTDSGTAYAWAAWRAARAAAPQAALSDERELLAKFLDFADSDYVPNVLFDRARALLATAPTERMSDAVRDVLAERARHVSVEGWTPEHDDEHREREMAMAAAAYAMHASRRGYVCLDVWPWATEWWKPTKPRQDLVKAGSLILAEIERIDRAARKAEIERSGSAGGEAC